MGDLLPKIIKTCRLYGKKLVPVTPSLDQHDVRLLGVLQEDATLSINEMAERINLSPNACWKRIKRLEAEGYVKKRVALLDAQKLGAGVTVLSRFEPPNTQTNG